MTTLAFSKFNVEERWSARAKVSFLVDLLRSVLLEALPKSTELALMSRAKHIMPR